jgi:2-polyprenyl-6-methoxyphenol hydroxylase-like FAD-dependent oxidoreductase
MDENRVLVVGAGPVGLVTALVLARAGVPVTVIETEASIIPSPRALVYHPPTLEAMGRLGLMEDFEAEGVLKRELLFQDIDGNFLAEIDYRNLGGVTRYPYNLHLGQDRVAAIALAHLGRVPGATVLWSHRLTGIEQTASDVTAIVETPQGEKRLTGRYLVGADGASSATRQILGLGFEGTTWPTRFIATNVRHDFTADGYRSGAFVIDPDHWAIIMKIDNDGLWRFTYGESDELPVEAYRERIDGRYRRLMRGSGDYELVASAPYRVHNRSAEKFRVGRCLLAGDAAHINNPVGGLGLTSGLLDAVALGYPLAAVFLGRQDDAILDRYAAERRRIFVEITSPTAAENLRRFEERDPVRKAADLERFRQLREDKDFNRHAASFTFSLASPELADPTLLEG